MKQVEVLYALMFDSPSTVSDICEFYGEENTNAVGNTVTRLWREGFVVRRKVDNWNKACPTPYEYAIRPPESWDFEK